MKKEEKKNWCTQIDIKGTKNESGSRITDEVRTRKCVVNWLLEFRLMFSLVDDCGAFVRRIVPY